MNSFSDIATQFAIGIVDAVAALPSRASVGIASLFVTAAAALQISGRGHATTFAGKHIVAPSHTIGA